MDERHFSVWFPQKYKTLTLNNYIITNSDSLEAFAATMFCTKDKLNKTIRE